MHAIYKQLASPEWWFTVVVVSLIVGVAAAYAKDALTAAVSRLSVSYERRASLAKAKEVRRASAYVSNPALLVIQYVRTSLGLLTALAMLTATFVLPAWDVLQTQFPQVDLGQRIFGLPPAPPWMTLATSGVCFVSGNYAWWKFFRRLLECEKVRIQLMRSESQRQGVAVSEPSQLEAGSTDG